MRRPSEKNIQRVLISLNKTPMTWGQLLKESNFSNAALSKYLKILRKEKKVKKSLDKDGKVIYEINRRIIENVIPDFERMKKHIKKVKKSIKLLDEHGLFDGGMSEKEILKFLARAKNTLMLDFWNSMIDENLKKNKLDIKVFSIFFNDFLGNKFFLFEDDGRIKAKIKIQDNPKRILEDLDQQLVGYEEFIEDIKKGDSKNE